MTIKQLLFITPSVNLILLLIMFVRNVHLIIFYYVNAYSVSSHILCVMLC